MSIYPEFTELGRHHEEEFTRITSRFDFYSDFNLNAIFTWSDSNYFSILNGNLVLKTTDAITHAPFITLLGDTLMDETLPELLSISGRLELVPEVVVTSLSSPDRFSIEEDRDYFDYIYSLSELSQMAGGGRRKFRSKVNQFARVYPDHALMTLQSVSDVERDELLTIFLEWAREKGCEPEQYMNEYEAFGRFLRNVPSHQMVGVRITVGSRPAGFSIASIAGGSECAECHFQKVLHGRYRNIDAVVVKYISKVLLDRGCKYAN